MKKFAWLAALLLVISVVFFGCDDREFSGTPPEPLEEMVVFDLATYLKGAKEGDDDLEKFLGDDYDVLATAAGSEGTDVSFKVVKLGDDMALEITTIQSWAGLDILSGKIGFKAGDIIELAGKVAAGSNSQLMLQYGNAWGSQVSGNSVTYQPEGGLFDFTGDDAFELTQADADGIRIYNVAYNPGGCLRIRASDSGVITLTSFKVTGMRMPGFLD
jgi:hypothetical protein